MSTVDSGPWLNLGVYGRNAHTIQMCPLGYGAQTSAWIGLVDPTENSKHAANCTCWKWLDGSPYNYENFEPREPNNVGGKEWCTIVDLSQSSASAGKWLDWNCGGLSKPALCSVPTKPSTTPASTSPTAAERSTPSTPHASSEPIKPAASTTKPVTRVPTTAEPNCPVGWSYCPAASRCYKVCGGFAA